MKPIHARVRMTRHELRHLRRMIGEMLDAYEKDSKSKYGFRQLFKNGDELQFMLSPLYTPKDSCIHVKDVGP